MIKADLRLMVNTAQDYKCLGLGLTRFDPAKGGKYDMRVDYLWSKLLKKLRGSAIVNSNIHKTSKVESGSHIVNTSFDRHSFCGYDCTIINCRVGSFCSIANGVTIGGSRHPIEFVSTSPVFLSHKDSVKTKLARHHYSVESMTTIGNDVWLCERAMIKTGVIIGHGAVVGMGSIVTKDVQPYAIVAGIPAKLIRMRFDDETIKTLLDYQWWGLPDDRLRDVAKYFNDISSFLKFARKQ
jgi:acetyltransferase-like isoleucine patch superfamily enzyme